MSGQERRPEIEDRGKGISETFLKIIGRVGFFLLWPLIWFYAPLTRRVRILVKTPLGFVGVKNTLGPGQWQLPGGGIRFSESVEDAAKRELQEELSLVADDLNVFNKEPVICQQWGLLFRLHIAYVELDKIPTKHSRAITELSYVSNDEPMNVSAEVKLAFALADRHGL